MVNEFTTPVHADAPVRGRRLAHRITVSLISILLVLSAGAIGYLAFLNHTVTTNVRHAALLTTPNAGSVLPIREPSVKGAQNILLIGSDSRGILAGGRSDVIVVVHISSDRKNVYLVHFPRDMYVEVPGHDKDKINAAYAYGGPQLLVRMLGKLVDVPIDQLAVIGFDGFKAMTDAAGGGRRLCGGGQQRARHRHCACGLEPPSMVRLRLGSCVSCTSSASATSPEDVASWPLSRRWRSST